MKQVLTDMAPLIIAGLIVGAFWMLVIYWDKKKERDLQKRNTYRSSNWKDNVLPKR